MKPLRSGGEDRYCLDLMVVLDFCIKVLLRHCPFVATIGNTDRFEYFSSETWQWAVISTFFANTELIKRQVISFGPLISISSKLKSGPIMGMLQKVRWKVLMNTHRLNGDPLQ